MRVALDTNVVSEVIRPQSDPSVMAWIRTLATGELALPAPCLAELRIGLLRLPAGARRLDLEQAVDAFIEQIPAVLPFDQAAAEAYSHLMTVPGRPRSTMDGLIASICLAYDLPLATRNVRDFADCGIETVNPWEPDPCV